MGFQCLNFENGPNLSHIEREPGLAFRKAIVKGDKSELKARYATDEFLDFRNPNMKTGLKKSA